MSIEAWLTSMGISQASAVTGAVGAAAAAIRGEGGVVQRVVSFAVGFCVAAWGAGVVVSVFNLPNTPTFQGALGFTLGYLGMSIADAAMAAAAALKAIDWAALLAAALKRITG